MFWPNDTVFRFFTPKTKIRLNSQYFCSSFDDDSACTLRCLKMCEQLWLWFVWLFVALEVLRTFFVAAPERGCRKLHKSQITVMANFKIRFSRKTLTWLPHAFTLCGEILPCCHQWSRQSWLMDNSDQHYNIKGCNENILLEWIWQQLMTILPSTKKLV